MPMPVTLCSGKEDGRRSPALTCSLLTQPRTEGDPNLAEYQRLTADFAETSALSYLKHSVTGTSFFKFNKNGTK